MRQVRVFIDFYGVKLKVDGESNKEVDGYSSLTLYYD